ncbi:DUF721 domain-containing protein [Acuticoccus mangrovi]|uniref:DUF721 domain-containing protein n=1 Tax=Acuticoccus mangrovi TaxID=2796142 RepID=A0A934IVM7_9HYPH|nr:DciA family protein [Acuticoccus mangrovi]MBJ3778860.1 DUF721 domain-containing protein [Acuticoccus mangrovi]
MTSTSRSSPCDPVTVHRAHGPRPLAEMIGSLVSPACRSRGVANAALLLDPVEIFGERFARGAAIERIVWPKSEGRSYGATLVIRAEASCALSIQHVAPQIVERANILIGWPAIARIRVTQTRGWRARRASRLTPVAETPPPADPAAIEAMAAEIDGVAHQDLKRALSRLGVSVRRRSLSKARKAP